MPPQQDKQNEPLWATPDALLRASPIGDEVRFWRQLIESAEQTQPSRECMERMRQALALAEYRLAIQAAEIRDHSNNPVTRPLTQPVNGSRQSH